MTEAGRLSRVLYVDLTRRHHWVSERPELFDGRLGGTGVGIRLLSEECRQGTDPLGPENPIILCSSLLSGVFPLTSKMIAMFKSPLTGNLGESHAGGRAAVALRMAGYGAMVIRGGSETPVYLAVKEDEVRLRDASVMWGMGSSSTVCRIIGENEGSPGIRSIMNSGRAGDYLVRYASVAVDTYRHFGRLGLGAVFGSKKLKAVVISGKKSLTVSDPRGYRDLYDELFRTFTASPLLKKYHDLGTPANVLVLNATKTLPTKNLQAAQFTGAEALSGEELAKNFLGRRAACAHCPVSCVHIAAVRVRYPDEPYFYRTKMISYDYEPIFALGTMLDIRSAEDYFLLMDRAEELGLDAMTAGVALAWATEALERGIITTKDTDGVVLKWGDHARYMEALDKIVEQRNDFYRALARGTEYAASKYGGKDFALVFGGNEMPGYHTGLATYLGHIVGSRHSHLDGAGYSYDQKVNAMKKPAIPAEAAKALFEEEAWRQILSSIGACFFARAVYTPEVVCRCLRVLGKECTPAELRRLGESILREKYAFKFREGFSLSPEAVHIPKRVLELPTPQGILREEDFREGIREFERLIRGGGSSA